MAGKKAKPTVTRFRVGDKVRVTHAGRRSGIAIIEAKLTDIKGGVRLDRSIYGFEFWNEADLVKI